MFNYILFNYGLPILIFAKNTYNILVYDISYYYTNAIRAFSSNELYFFENNPSAYLSSFIKSHNENSGLVVWKFNMYHNIFYSYNCAFKDTKRFPILSASLENDSTKINLDDFFENIRVETSNPGFPTLQQVVEVYSYKSGTVFDRTKQWKLNILDNSLNEYTLEIFKDSWPFTSFTKN